MLLRRVQISSNRSLDGVLDQLNSKDMTDAGPAQLLADAASDEDELLPPSTAGAALRCAQALHVASSSQLLSAIMITLPRWLRVAVACHLHWMACSCSTAQPIVCSHCNPGHAWLSWDRLLELLHAGGPSGVGDLPGTGGGRRPQVRSRAVALSPTGQSWAAATTEGLLLYSLDQGATFDPTNLTEDITPQVSS